jgi:PhoPQ-activated pathogenicity-related protein
VRIANRFQLAILLLVVVHVLNFTGCAHHQETTLNPSFNPIKDYATATKSEYSYKLYKTIPGKGYTTHILRMISGTWLTEKEVKDPTWWHWVHIVVPDSLSNSPTALLMIAGGKREESEPKDANASLRQIALQTGCLVVNVHNVPNQPLFFVNDPYGARSEDELIAYGWRKFMEAGGGDDQVRWLARLPMTRAAVRAMDAVSDYSAQVLKHPVKQFVTAGGSKRGWTTWMTAVADERVIAMSPIVIDLLNLEESFKHHWRAYGKWSSAIDDYVHEGVMDWMGSVEFRRLLKNVDPYSYRQRLQLPKLMINASGDEFFLADSWQFYWNDLVGEKHIRYVPNTGHSLDKTDAVETLAAFFQYVIAQKTRPDFDWRVDHGSLVVQTRPNQAPQSIKLWQAYNDSARDFRVNVLGKVWKSSEIPLAANGSYRISVDRPHKGWRAFFLELTYPGIGKVPLKLTTGVTVVPEELPFGDFKPAKPMGTFEHR